MLTPTKPHVDCSFNFLGTNYSSFSACMNGYATPGAADPDACSGAAARGPLASTNAAAPRIAVLWADLASDGSISCPQSQTQSQLSWSLSATGSSSLDSLMRRSTGIAAAAEFTSTAYFTVTWENVRYAAEPVSTCSRSTVQLHVAVSSSTGECYVILIYTAVATPPSGSVPIVGLRGQLDALNVYSDSAPANTAEALISSSTPGSDSGVRIHRVDGLAEPNTQAVFVPTQSAAMGGTALEPGDDEFTPVSLSWKWVTYWLNTA